MQRSLLRLSFADLVARNRRNPARRSLAIPVLANHTNASRCRHSQKLCHPAFWSCGFLIAQNGTKFPSPFPSNQSIILPSESFSMHLPVSSVRRLGHFHGDLLVLMHRPPVSLICFTGGQTPTQQSKEPHYIAIPSFCRHPPVSALRPCTCNPVPIHRYLKKQPQPIPQLVYAPQRCDTCYTP